MKRETSQPDRERALLLLAGGSKLMQPEAQDVIALIDLQCECDADFIDGRYVKCSRYCPLHDDCSSCLERLGVRRLDRDWLCQECFDIYSKEDQK